MAAPRIEHALLVGLTQSGKSFLGQRICRSLRQAGHRTMVLDPKMDLDKWGRSGGKHWITNNVGQFVDIAWQNRNAYLFFDECGDYIGPHLSKEQERLAQLVTRGSGNGHRCYLMAQRPVQIARTLRDQCSILFCFTINWRDAEMLAEDFNDRAILQASELQPHHYIFKRLHQPAKMQPPLSRE